jgi:hypothetical protein
MAQQYTDWHHLAEQASKELDPRKLLHLVAELNRALDQNEGTSRGLALESNDLLSTH